MIMKNINIYIIILLLAIPCVSCQKEDPVTLTFEDVYGRDSWEVEDEGGLPAGVFIVKKTNEITVNEEGTVETGLTFNISTTGVEPHFTTQRITKALPGGSNVLSFMYKSSQDVNLGISLDIYKTAGYTKMFTLPLATEWTEYSFDLGNVISAIGWGGIGSYFRMYLGEESGAELNVKELQVRARNPEEEALANALFIVPNLGAINQIDEMLDITEINTIGGVTYKYLASSGASDPWVMTLPRDRAIAADEIFLTFEYKCENSGGFQYFFAVRGGAATPELPFTASSEWTEVTFDLSPFIPGILGAHADALDAGLVSRCDINGVAGVPFYFRAIRIHK